MNAIFQYDHYLLKRQVFALTGKFRYYDPQGNLVMFSFETALQPLPL